MIDVNYFEYKVASLIDYGQTLKARNDLRVKVDLLLS